MRHTPAGTAHRASPPAWPTAHAVVVVRDHGAGLDADTFEHAFDRFWQADHARTGAGAGLGLSIVAAIVHEHGGRVTAANAADGGAVFTISLPLEPVAPTPV